MIGDLIQAVTTPLVNFGVALSYSAWYPFAWVFNLVRYHMLDSMGEFIDVMVALTTLPGFIFTYSLNMVDTLFPSQWVALLVIMFSLNIGLRLYTFLRGLKILGTGV